MEYGSLRTGSNLHENIAEFVEAQALQIDPDGTVNSIARIVCVERIVLGNSNEVHLLLKGIVRPAADAPAKEGTKHLRRHGWSALPQQLILHGASALVVGVYVNLLRRCLKVVAASLQEEGTSSSCSGSGEQYNAVLVPGAGAGELTWSLLWSQLASYLSNCDMSDARRSSKDENSQTTSLRAVACTEGGTLEDVLRPLVSCLGEAIARRLAHSCPVALPECVHLCEILSAAYQQVPLTLLANAKDVLPASLLGDLNAASGADAEVAGNMRNPGNINRALQVWSHRLQSAGEGRGRLGLVYCTDVDAEYVL